jgi:type II secretory pathway pseudopilin PulG
MDATPHTATRVTSREAGFSLIEVVVALLIAVVVVIAVGLLSENLARRRASADSLSAAVSLAEGQMEQLFALPNPATHASLTAGAHGPCGTPPCPVGVNGVSNASGPYLLQWTVIDNSSSGTPLVDSTASSKKLTVTVSHQSDPYANVNLQTYYDYR